MSLYATDGSINVSVVDGSTYTGLYAADGSLNVVISDGSVYRGAYHPCGALWISLTPTTSMSLRAPDGSLYVTDSPYSTQGQEVTAVSGSLHPTPGTSSPTFYILGF